MGKQNRLPIGVIDAKADDHNAPRVSQVHQEVADFQTGAVPRERMDAVDYRAVI